MPCAGRLTRMLHVPGELFSVNPTTARGVPGLFARNERVVCVFDGAAGPFVLVLVGATIVGSMATVWHGVVNPPRPGQLREWRYDDAGRSSWRRAPRWAASCSARPWCCCYPEGGLQFNPAWMPGGAIRMGEPMARRWVTRAGGPGRT